MRRALVEDLRPEDGLADDEGLVAKDDAPGDGAGFAVGGLVAELRTRARGGELRGCALCASLNARVQGNWLCSRCAQCRVTKNERSRYKSRGVLGPSRLPDMLAPGAVLHRARASLGKQEVQGTPGRRCCRSLGPSWGLVSACDAAPSREATPCRAETPLTAGPAPQAAARPQVLETHAYASGACADPAGEQRTELKHGLFTGS